MWFVELAKDSPWVAALALVCATGIIRAPFYVVETLVSIAQHRSTRLAT